jgi:hypothetical protein
MKEFLCCYHKKYYTIYPLNLKNTCKSLINKCKEQHHSLKNVSLKKFIANYDTKTCKKCGHDKIISWVSFNFHKDL